MTSRAPLTPVARRRPAYAEAAFGERLPYTLLGLIFVLGGLADWMFDLTSVHDPMLHSTDLVGGAVLVCAGVLLAWLGPMAATGWPLDLALGFGYLLAALAELRIGDAIGITSLGYSLLVYGVFAAIFRPPRRLAVHLVLMMALYVVAAVRTGIDLDPALMAYICAFVIGVSSLVALLAGRLRRMALHDALTGVLNRHGMEVMADLVAANAARSDAPVTLCLVDLDLFKEFNDRVGHVAGDQRLRSVAQAWNDEVRATDLVARYGGDEFAVVLPGATRDDADELVRRVRDRVDAPFSVGMATWLPAEDLYVALGRADEHLRAAKDARDSV